MRKISKVVCQAFIDGRNVSKGNTVSKDGNLYLHGNEIAGHFLGDPNIIIVTLAGWPTVTTRERLNALLALLGSNGRFFQAGGKQFYRPHAQVESHEITSTQWIRVKG